MAYENDIRLAGHPATPAVNWRGESGRYYVLAEENLETFALEGGNLYVVVENGMPIWTGIAADLVDDHASRASFRVAMTRATAVLRLDAPGDDVERAKIQWDIAGGRMARSLSMAS